MILKINIFHVKWYDDMDEVRENVEQWKDIKDVMKT